MKALGWSRARHKVVIDKELVGRRRLADLRRDRGSRGALRPTTTSEVGLNSVVPGTVAHVVDTSGRATGDADLDAAKLGVGEPLIGVVGEQILGAEFVADLAEGVVELGH